VKTVLTDRELFYDGTSRVKPALVPELFLYGVPPEKVAVTELSEDVELFNQLSDVLLQVNEPADFNPDLSWNLPEHWANLDLDAYFEGRLARADDRYKARALAELKQVRERGLENLIRAIGYVVERFKETGQVWGVGRGSSCASLLLFLLGLHQVDPIKYNIPLEEFFHD
jgi:DNA polymerase III alpha subunit